MRKIIIVFLLIVSNLTAQEFITPLKTNSFGLNHHTNRDISFFTVTDNNNNVFNIGTTERDSSYTDIIISKFDINLNLNWQNIYSLDTGLSYDTPMDSYIDSGNNLILIGRSSFKQTTSNGLLFVVKYDSNGNLLWQKILGNIDGSDYYDYDYYHSHYEDDILRISYAPRKVNSSTRESEIHFLTIDSFGNTTEALSTTVINNGIYGTYKNGIHYTIVREDAYPNPTRYYLRRKSATIDENYLLNDDENFVVENFTQVISIFKFSVDVDDNLYITKPKQSGNGAIAYTKINAFGEIEFSKNLPTHLNYVESYIDSNNTFNIIYNDTGSNTLDLNKLDNAGNETLVSSIDFNNFAGSKLNHDHSLFVVNSTNQISLLQKDLTLINTFSYNTTYALTDITKIDNNHIISSGTSFDQMYPNSDFLSQRNIHVEKSNTTQTLNTYVFSGEGTSKAYRQALIIDNDDNYLVASEEKMGPDNVFIGGSRGPLNKSIYKYDKNLNLLWRLEIPNFIFTQSNLIVDADNNLYINTKINAYNYELFKISPDGQIIFQVQSFQNKNLHIDQNNNIVLVSSPTRNDATYDDDTFVYTMDANTGNLIDTKTLEGLEFLKSYKTENGDSYMYLYTGGNSYNDTDSRMDVYKNLTLEFSINIAITGTYGDILYVDLADNGDLFFASSWAQINERLHKITLSGTYSLINISHNITRIKVLKNGKIFTIERHGGGDAGPIKIYNNDLTLHSSSPDTFYNYSSILEINGLILVNSYYDNMVNVLNEEAILVDKFKIESNFGYASLDSNDDLIMTGKFGNMIYIYHMYSWARGLIHKYDYNDPSDSDGDGIGDRVDLCPDTPSGESISSNGCSESQIDDDEDGIMNDIDLCPNTPIGESTNADGCSGSQLDVDGDGIMNNIDVCPNSVILSLVDENGCFSLPVNNFTIESMSETCPNKNNGKIIISANEELDYLVTLNGDQYSLTNNLSFENLAPGNYDLCISVPSESFEQCYSITIKESVSITGRTSMKSGKISIDIEGGTAPYDVFKNGISILQTNLTSFSIDAQDGDTIEVRTDKTCEGSFLKTLNVNEIFAYPNPTSGRFEIALPEISSNEINIEIYNNQSQLISNLNYPIIEGKIKLDLKDISNGVYFAKIYLKESIVIRIIKQ